MQKSKLLKGMTLLSSLFLVTMFLLYRGGKFDSLIRKEEPAFQTSPNGGPMSSNQTDTLPPKKDSTERLMLYSSKSMVLAEKKYTRPDTSKKKAKLDSVKTKRKTLMSSSKSGPMIEPSTNLIPPPRINIDSIKKDSAVLKYKKRQ